MTGASGEGPDEAVEDRAVVDAIHARLESVATSELNGDTFFFVGTDPADQRMPFATLVTSDAHDQASNLDRAGVYRLNIGVRPETYEARFGPLPPGPIAADPVHTGHDYTALDRLMPHPIYSPLGWLCVLNPSPATLEALWPLLEEAHAIALERRARRESRG